MPPYHEIDITLPVSLICGVIQILMYLAFVRSVTRVSDRQAARRWKSAVALSALFALSICVLIGLSGVASIVARLVKGRWNNLPELLGQGGQVIRAILGLWGLLPCSLTPFVFFMTVALYVRFSPAAVFQPEPALLASSVELPPPLDTKTSPASIWDRYREKQAGLEASYREKMPKR